MCLKILRYPQKIQIFWLLPHEKGKKILTPLYCAVVLLMCVAFLNKEPVCAILFDRVDDTQGLQKY